MTFEKKHKLSNGKEIIFERRKIFGMADDDGTITVDTRVRPGTRRDLEIALHELLHLECLEMSEAEVDRIANSQARLLWALGWRMK